MSTLFPEPTPSEQRHPCEWCGEPSVERVIVAPARWSSRTGVRVLAQHAIEVDACREHAAMVQAAIDAQEAERQAAIAARKATK